MTHFEATRFNSDLLEIASALHAEASLALPAPFRKKVLHNLKFNLLNGIMFCKSKRHLKLAEGSLCFFRQQAGKFRGAELHRRETVDSSNTLRPDGDFDSGTPPARG